VNCNLHPFAETPLDFIPPLLKERVVQKKGIAKAVSILLLVSAFFIPWVLDADASGKRARAKHIIFFIGDGMQLEHEIAASRYLFGRDAELSFHKLMYKGYVATWDVTTYNRYALAGGLPFYDAAGFDPTVGYDPIKGGLKPYPAQGGGINDAYFLTELPSSPTDSALEYPATDSASAATAWATGIKTDDGNISWKPGDPAAGALKTIAELLREQKGFSIGVVSTVPFSHATPAAHVSHNASRTNHTQIATEIIRNVQPEVVIGGGYPGPGGTEKYNYLSEADYSFLRSSDPANPYLFVERESGADGSVSLLEVAHDAAEQGKKLFGLFGGPGGNFESPVAYDFPGTPLVARATMENPLLKDATLAALKVLGQDPDGFFIMVEQGNIDGANHANDFQSMVGTIWDLHTAVQAAIDFVNQPEDGIDWSNTLLIVTSDHSNSYMRLHAELTAGDLPMQEGTCGDGGPPCTYPEGEVSYATTSHTNELVMLYAQGAFQVSDFKKNEGRWYPCSRIIDNTQLYHIMAEAAGTPQASFLRPVVERPKTCD
jgi:alkaline phosphatase